MVVVIYMYLTICLFQSLASVQLEGVYTTTQINWKAWSLCCCYSNNCSSWVHTLRRGWGWRRV